MMGAYRVAIGSFTKIRTAVYVGLRFVRLNVPASVYIVIWIGTQFLGASLAGGHQAGVAWYGRNLAHSSPEA